MPGPAGAPYCTPSQLAQVVQPAVLSLATGAQQTQACVNATAEADSYLSNRFEMPLLSWGADLTLYTSYLAAYQLVRLLIGVAPQAGSDDVYDTLRRLAIGGKRNEENAARQEGWFEKVQRQAIVPDVTPTLAVGSDPGHDAPQVTSLPQRGWQQGNRVGGF